MLNDSIYKNKGGPMKIFGAGLSGLIAGIYFPRSILFEKNKEPVLNHHAVLRFRTDEVSSVTGIKFNKVNVVKSIYSEGREHNPSPRLVALYSKKVIGKYENRSIIDISTKERYIAPNDFHELLVEQCIDRINFGYEITNKDFSNVFNTKISTLPISVNSQMLGYDFNVKNTISHIFINKLKIIGCQMYSTVYFPDISTSVYRASITDDILIIESMTDIDNIDIATVLAACGLTGASIDHIMINYKQVTGKLAEINDSDRRVQIYKMSHDHNVFSLGRLALHKTKLLLDDIPHDLRVIRDMNNDDSYGISVMNRG